MFLATPAESCDCLSRLFGGCGARTTYRAPYYAQNYAPAYSAPACGSCVPQTVRYVPQTYYRTVYRPVPVTTCRAFCGSDPCNGCPVTYYRPVTGWTYQAAYVPYTTYRLVYSNPCSPCATTGSYFPYAPGVGAAFAAGAACTPSISGATDSTNGQAPGGSPTPGTFKNGDSKSSQESMKPVEDPEASSATGPDLTDPSSRTTFRPARQAVRFRLITSPSKPAANPRPPLDDGGWQAAGD
jgi:hypothetical protein